jgi:hypothetical protein
LVPPGFTFERDFDELVFNISGLELVFFEQYYRFLLVPDSLEHSLLRYSPGEKFVRERQTFVVMWAERGGVRPGRPKVRGFSVEL